MYDDIIESNGYSSFSPPIADNSTPGDYQVEGSFGSLYAQPSQQAPIVQGNVLNAGSPSIWERLNTPRVEGNYASTPLVQGLRGLANIFPQGRAINEANMAQEQQIFSQQQAQRAQRAQLQQAERQAVFQGFEIINHIDKLGPAAQKAAFNMLGKKMAVFTGEENSPTLDLFRQSKEEEREKLKKIYQAYFENNPTAGVKDIDGFTELLLTNPKQANEFLEGAVAREKHELQKKQNEALLQVLQGTAGVEGSAPAGPVSTPQPSGYSVGQQSAQPRQAAFEAQVDSIGQALRADPETLKKVKASGAIETIGYDSKAVSPAGARGVLQFVGPTAKQYGVEDPHNNEQAIAGAIRYYQFLEKKFPGRPDLQFAAYNAGEGRVQNAGGIPNIKETQEYVQKAMARYGRPSSISVAQGANDAEAVTLGRMKSRQVELDKTINKLTPFMVTNPQVKGLVDQLQQERKYVQDEVRRIEDQYDKNKVDEDTRIAGRTLFGDTPWHQLDKEQKAAAIALSPELAAQRAALKAQKTAEAEEPSKLRAAKAGNAAQSITDHDKYRGRNGETLSAGATREDIRKKDEEWAREHPGENYWVKTQKLESEQREKLTISALMVKNLQKLADNYGTITTGPIAGRVEKLKAAYGGDVDSEAVAQRVILTRVNNELGQSRGGVALTPTEIERIKSELPQAEEPPNTFRVKLNAALELVHELHSLRLAGLEEDGYTGLKPYRVDAPRFVDKPVEKITEKPAAAPKTNESQPNPTTPGQKKRNPLKDL